MTNNPTIDGVSRGLLVEAEISLRQTGVDVSLAADLRNILEAPVVEKAPISEDAELLNIRISQLTVALDQSTKAQLENYHMATRAWTELAELQAEIERLRNQVSIGAGHIFAYKLSRQRLLRRARERELELIGMQATIAQQAAEIERLKAGRGEAVAYSYKVRVHATGIGMVWRDKIEQEAPDTEAVEVKDLFPLYTSQPAPVSVVLPERVNVSSKSVPFRNNYIADGYISGWNACLDKVKELNP